VRGNQAWKETVSLLLTTEAQVGQLGPALAAGANGDLTKPFTKHALRERLQLVGLSAV
jgi:CheY-like chemotaxis protein